MHTDSSKRNKIILFYIAEALILAWLFGLFSFYVIYRNIAGGVPLYAYIWNLIFIVSILLLEKLIDRIILSKRFVVNEQTPPYMIAAAKLLYVTHTISFKTALYAYYLIILLVSRAAVLEPAVISDHIRIYIHSVEYCVLLLIPFDKFTDQLIKDDKRTKKLYAKLMLKKAAEIEQSQENKTHDSSNKETH